jgi:hypothetical protein
MNETNDPTSTPQDEDIEDTVDDRTQRLPRTEATQQLPVQDEAESTQIREPVEAAVFGAVPAAEAPAADVPAAPTAPIATAGVAGVAADAGGPDTTAPTATASQQWPPPVPPRPTGPHTPAIILGLVVLAIAGIVLAQELGNLTVDWGDVGPPGFVAVGAVLVVLGAVGLISSNRRSARS